MRAPLPRHVADAYHDLLATRDRLLADGLDSDEAQLWQDMLEGEATRTDPWTAMDYLVGIIRDAEQKAEAIRNRRTELAERMARFDKRAERWREAAQEFLTRLEVNKLERPEYTASIGRGPARVIPTAEPEELPDRFRRVDVRANLTALGDALKAGEADVPAAWSNAPPRLSIRTR